MFNFTPSHSKGLIILGLLTFGAISYIPTYILTLEHFEEISTLPFIESAKFLNSIESEDGVFTMHPDLLARYYEGPIYQIPEEGGFEHILEEAKKKGVRYLIIESTCVNYGELTRLYYHSVNPSWSGVPSEFVLVKAKEWEYGIYLIQMEVEFEAAIFSHLEWGFHSSWETMLALMGASISTFDDSTIITEVDIIQFNVVVFVDFKRPLDDAERLHLKESVQNGLIVIVSGLSPYYLAGGTKNLTRISSWFGATVFSEAPPEARWKVKFTENTTQIMKDLNLDREYAFYTDSDWSTPTGCFVQPEPMVCSYRVTDQAAAIFLHKFGKGSSIFSGPRFGFASPDAETFKLFLRSMILSALE